MTSEPPGAVFVYEERGRIVVEPVPSPDELHGIHAGEHDHGAIAERVRERRDDERRDGARAARLRPSEDA